MLALQLAAIAVGAIVIRALHSVRRRLTGTTRYFSFSDFLIEERHVQTRGFLYMAVPPFLGGFLLGLIPLTDPLSAGTAGCLAALAGVWPVYQFPYHLLDVDLLPYWSKLKILYLLFIGFSTSLAYLGCVLAHQFVPLAITFSGTTAWQNFLDNLAANAIYDITKAVVIGLFVASGVYVSRERKRIGNEVETKRETESNESRQRAADASQHERV